MKNETEEQKKIRRERNRIAQRKRRDLIKKDEAAGIKKPKRERKAPNGRTANAITQNFGKSGFSLAIFRIHKRALASSSNGGCNASPTRTFETQDTLPLITASPTASTEINYSTQTTVDPNEVLQRPELNPVAKNIDIYSHTDPIPQADSISTSFVSHSYSTLIESDICAEIEYFQRKQERHAQVIQQSLLVQRKTIELARQQLNDKLRLQEIELNRALFLASRKQKALETRTN